MNIRLSIAVIKSSPCYYFAAQMVQNSFPRKCIILVCHIFINFSTGFQKFPLQTQKVRLPRQPKKRLMESLVSGSFQTVNIAGEGNCTFSRILEIVLFFFAVRQKADRAAGRGRGCFFAARVVG